MERPPANTMRIAIADDDEDIRQYFRRILPRLGHEVVGEAENGRVLVELCRSQHPDLIITDIMMPEMNGLEAVAQINKAQNVPVIIVSSNEPSEQHEHASVVEHLIKPISSSDLKAAIARVSLE